MFIKKLFYFSLSSFLFFILLSVVVLANSDGTLDTTFDPGIGPSDLIRTTSLQSDGKIIIGGDFTTYAGLNRNRIARINSNGTLDTTFNSGTGFNSPVHTTVVQPNGKILAGGDFTSFEDVGAGRIIRMNSDGSLDSTFATGSGVNGPVFSISVQSDGKIILGGRFSNYNGSTRRSLVRVNSDGTIDNTFNVGSGVAGSIDADLGTVYSTSIQPDGKIIVGGYFVSYNGTIRNNIARVNTDGTLDTTFNPGVGANSWIMDTLIQADGKVIIGGSFTSYNGTIRNNIARVNTDGTLDTTFNPGVGADHEIYSLSLEKTNKIFIGGVFTKYNNTTRNNIARINSDGTLDTSFNSNTEPNKVVFSTLLQSDDKLIIAGALTVYNGVARKFIARLTDSGNSGSNNFNNSTPAPTTAPDMSPESDTGTSNTDNITSDATPDFVTQCISGSLVTLYVDGVLIPQTSSCVNGGATITPINPLTTNHHNITYTQKVNSIESAQSPALSIIISNDDSGPLINGITTIGQNASTTPAYTFTSSKAGTIVYGGSCSSSTTHASFGFNNIVFNPLVAGLYTNCTIKVIDAVGNSSNIITIPSFTVTGTQSNNQNLSTEGCTAFTAYSPINGNKCPIVSTGNNTFVDTNPVVCPHFTKYVKFGSKSNDINEVKRWQDFLNSSLSSGLSVDGKFGRMTLAAVKNFQAQYATAILLPWGLTEPTGYIYKSTRAKANKLFGCFEGIVTLENGTTIQ